MEVVVVIFFLFNLHTVLSTHSLHKDADRNTILALVDDYATDSLELRERVKGDEGLLILRDSSQKSEGDGSSGGSSFTDAQSASGRLDSGSGSHQTGSAGSSSGEYYESSSSGSEGSASGMSGRSVGSGSDGVLEVSQEEQLRVWLNDELVRMTTVVYDCRNGEETVGDWRNETVGDWLVATSIHTQDSLSVLEGSGSGIDEPKERDERFIFGKDERQFVTNSSDFPQCAVARMSTGCTAFFIGPYHALTAGHCVNNFRYGWRPNIKLWRERNCHDKGFRSTCSRVFSVYGHTHLKMYDYDYALVELERNGTPAPCWFGIGYNYPWDYPSHASLEILGYPYDKRWYSGQPECTYEAMWLSKCNVSYSVHQNLLQWCDAVSGNSGSPVFSETNKNKVVYGLHAQSIGRYVYDDDGNRDIEELWNQGPLITPLRYHQILRWMDL